MTDEQDIRNERQVAERIFRDEITADFKAGKIGIENGWLVEYVPPCPHPCAGVYGCPPECGSVPIADLYSLFEWG